MLDFRNSSSCRQCRRQPVGREKECVRGISCRDSRAVTCLATACHVLFQSDVSAEFGWMVSLLGMSERYLRQRSAAMVRFARVPWTIELNTRHSRKSKRRLRHRDH
jgi:hypothetical protein